MRTLGFTSVKLCRICSQVHLRLLETDDVEADAVLFCVHRRSARMIVGKSSCSTMDRANDNVLRMCIMWVDDKLISDSDPIIGTNNVRSVCNRDEYTCNNSVVSS